MVWFGSAVPAVLIPASEELGVAERRAWQWQLTQSPAKGMEGLLVDLKPLIGNP